MSDKGNPATAPQHPIPTARYTFSINLLYKVGQVIILTKGKVHISVF